MAKYGSSGGMKGGNMLAGLKDKAPYCEDSSTKLPKGPNVASEATRSKTAEAEPTIGPRNA